MYQIDDSTAVTTQPTSTTLGTVGFFTDGNAATGEEATIVPAEFLNMVMLELLNAVEGAGLTASKSEFNQLYTAIQTIAQGGGSNYGTDAGAANAYAVTYSPTVDAPADGMTRAFKVKTANTGASTFALDGSTTTYPIYGPAGVALTGGELAANGIALLRFNSTLAGWVLIYCSGGASQLATGSYLATSPAQFNSSTKIATMAAVQRALGNFQTHVTGGSGTITAAQVGSSFLYTSSAASIVLPTAGSVPNGGSYRIMCSSTATLTVSGGGGMIVGAGGSNTITSLSLNGDEIVAVSDGNSAWMVYGSATLSYTGGFSSSLASAGYQKLPSGLIVQWGSGTASSSGFSTFSYPLTFPTACYQVTGAVQNNAATSSITLLLNNYSTSACQGAIVNTSAGYVNYAFSYIAIGH